MKVYSCMNYKYFTFTYIAKNWILITKKVLVSGSDGEFVPINIEDIAEVVEVDEDGSTYRTYLKEGSTDPILGR